MNEEELNALRARLGPNFDYSVFSRVLGSPMAAQLPDHIRGVMQQLAPQSRNPATAPADDATVATPIHGQPAQPAAQEPGFLEGLRQQMGVPTVEEAQQHPLQILAEDLKLPLDALQQFGHNLTAGLIPAPDVADRNKQYFDTMLKPLITIGALAQQGKWIVEGLGWASKLPKIAPVIEQLPERLKEVGVGIIAGSAIDAARPDVDLSGPQSKWDPTAYAAKPLVDKLGMNPRAAMALTGGAFGGLFTGLTMATIGGLIKGTNLYMASRLSDEDVGAIKAALQQAGVEVHPGADKYQVAEVFRKNLKAIQLGKLEAGAVADQLSREQYIADEFLNTRANSALVAGLNESEGRLLGGIMRTNPGNIALVHDIEDPASIEAAKQSLGMELHSVPITRPDGKTDLLVARPKYDYDSFTDKTMPKVTSKITEQLKRLAGEAEKDVTRPKTNDGMILADGTPIRGGVNLPSVATRLRMAVPVVDGVERPDLLVREVGRVVQMNIPEEGALVVDLPKQITQEQFNAIGRAADVMNFKTVTLKMGSTEQVLDRPVGGQVQDAMVKMVKPTAISNPITPEIASQVQRTGVFTGQAAILDDGTAATVLNKAGAVGYKVREAVTGVERIIHKNRLTLLPSSVGSEVQPSNMFLSLLNGDEQRAFGMMRRALEKGWTQPIEKFRDFERFAASRGYVAESLKGGKLRLQKLNDGTDWLEFKNMESAIEYTRKDFSGAPDITPDALKNLLGPNAQIGFAGGGGPPPHFNESIPLDWAGQQALAPKLAQAGGPGAFEQAYKPTLPLLRNIDSKFGTKLYTVGYNLRDAYVKRQGFVSKWFDGDPGNGVLPLKKIMDMAGKDANPETIGHWLEVEKGTPEEAQLLSQMTPGEQKAGGELRKWYDGMFKELQIDAPFVRNFMPHYQELAEKYGMDVAQAWKAMGGDPLKPPAGMEFISDHLREGLLDLYNKDAFHTALQYLRGGARNRFLKQPLDEARSYIQLIASQNERVAMPLAHMVQAMRGYEFVDQQAALQQSFKNMLDKLPGVGSRLDNSMAAEKAVTYLTNAVYNSTLGFRPSIALRNFVSSVGMNYPIFGGDGFSQAVVRTFSPEGMRELVEKGVVKVPTNHMFMDDESYGQLPKLWKQASQVSMKMFETTEDLNRGMTFYAARNKAVGALQQFADNMKNARPDQVEKFKDILIRDSKVYLYGDQAEGEFLRLAGLSPDRAADFAGKQGADFVNFMYGRGMQARWMRGVYGRLLGQFGTWPMWYIDYMGQISKAALNSARSGAIRTDAAKIFAKHALFNMAVIATGREVLNMDLSRWVAWPSFFFSGGPAIQTAYGLSTLMRGLGDVSGFTDSPYGQEKVKEGIQTLTKTLPTYVPFYFGFRDAKQFLGAPTARDAMAVALGGKVTQEYDLRRRIGMMLGVSPDEVSSDGDTLRRMYNPAYHTIDIRAVPSGVVPSNLPSAALRSAPGGVGGAPQAGSGGTPSLTSIRATMPLNGAWRGQNEVQKPAESNPIKDY